MISMTLSDVASGYRKHRVLGPLCAELEGVIGIVGPNGSGKSTLIRAMAGLQPHTGSIAIDGLAGRSRRDAIGYLPQGLPAGVSLTVVESLLVAGHHHSGGALSEQLAAAEQILTELGIRQLADRSLGELSGGQRQLVGMGQLLMRRPDVLLLDEPTSALDLQHQVDVLRITRERVATTGALGVVVLHDLNLAARFCDGLLLLRQGLIEHVGSPSAVLTPEILRQVYGVTARVVDDKGVPMVSAVAA